MSPELNSISTPEAQDSAFGGTTQAVLMGATAGSLTELPPAMEVRDVSASSTSHTTSAVCRRHLTWKHLEMLQHQIFQPG